MPSMTSSFPSISCVIATYNSQKTITSCLSSIRTQNYPQEKIEVIIADGSSTDETSSLVKPFRVRFFTVPKIVQNAEYNKGIAIGYAKGDILLFLDHDNILPHKKWLKKMVQPLIENADIIGVDALYIHYDRTYSLLDRYLALFGSLDPVAFYLGKSDKLPLTSEKYTGYGKVIQYNDYFIVTFDPDFVPTLGANGFLVRRKILLDNAMADPKHFFHTDVHVDLIGKGFNKYAFIKDDIIHLTGYQNILGFLKRRKAFMEAYHIKNKGMRRHSVFLPQDRGKLIKFIFYTLTFVKPTYDALRGFQKIPDIAWFLHPFLCFAFLSIYSYTTVVETGRNFFKKI